jgi:hypothetical protein
MCQLVYWFPKRNESIEMILRMILDQFSARGVSASLCETGSDCSDTDWHCLTVRFCHWSWLKFIIEQSFRLINGAKSSPVIISLQFLAIVMVSHIWRSGTYLGNFIILLPYQLPTAGDLGSIPTLPVSARRCTTGSGSWAAGADGLYFQPVQCLSVYFNKYLKLIPKPTDRGQDLLARATAYTAVLSVLPL